MTLTLVFLACPECDNWDFSLIPNTSYDKDDIVACKKCGKSNKICDLKIIEENKDEKI